MPQYLLGIEPGDIAPVVLLPGDPGRVELIERLADLACEVVRELHERDASRA